jgi:hypothetical protein
MPKINPCIYGQLTSTRGPRVYNEERTVSLTNGVRKSVYSNAEERNWTLVTLHTKWIK